MKKRLLYTVLSLGMIIGVLAGCGESAKEVSSSEDTQTAVEESVKAEIREELKEELREELKEELREELKEELEKELVENIEDESADIDNIKEDTEESVIDILFNYSYEDFKSLDYNELSLDLEDMDIDYEIISSDKLQDAAAPADEEIISSDKLDDVAENYIEFYTTINNIDFCGFNSYVELDDYRNEKYLDSKLIELEIWSDLGKGHASLDNKEKLIHKLQKCMYDKNSEYKVPIVDDEYNFVYVADFTEFGQFTGGLHTNSPDITTDLYVYLLDVYDVPDELLEKPRGGSWDNDLKIYKICIADFQHIPENYSFNFGEDLSVNLRILWLVQDGARFDKTYGSIGFLK